MGCCTRDYDIVYVTKGIPKDVLVAVLVLWLWTLMIMVMIDRLLTVSNGER